MFTCFLRLKPRVPLRCWCRDGTACGAEGIDDWSWYRENYSYPSLVHLTPAEIKVTWVCSFHWWLWSKWRPTKKVVEDLWNLSRSPVTVPIRQTSPFCRRRPCLHRCYRSWGSYLVVEEEVVVVVVFPLLPMVITSTKTYDTLPSTITR